MAKHSSKKNEIRSSRITLMFFQTVLLSLLLWAENFAYYRFDYIFRGMLPWFLPIACALSIALLIFLAQRCKKQTEAAQEKVFSPAFAVVLTLPLPTLFFFPWLASFGNGLQLFKLAVLLVLLGVISYFIGYLLYHLIRPAAALVCGSIAANSLALTYFYRMYLSPSRYILNAAEFGYLPIWAAALILCGILGIVLLLALYINRAKPFGMEKSVFLAPAGFSALLLLAITIADPWLSGLWIRILIFGSIGLQVVWLIINCVLLKMTINTISPPPTSLR